MKTLKTHLASVVICLAACQYSNAQNPASKIANALNDIAQYPNTKSTTSITSTTNYEIGPPHLEGAVDKSATVVTAMHDILTTTVEIRNDAKGHLTIDSVANFDPDDGTSIALTRQELIFDADSGVIVTNGKFGRVGKPDAVLQTLVMKQSPGLLLKSFWSPSTEFVKILTDQKSQIWNSQEGEEGVEHNLSINCDECPGGQVLRYKFSLDEVSNKLLHITRYAGGGNKISYAMEVKYATDGLISSIVQKHYSNIKGINRLSREQVIDFLNTEVTKTTVVSPRQFMEKNSSIEFQPLE